MPRPVYAFSHAVGGERQALCVTRNDDGDLLFIVDGPTSSAGLCAMALPDDQLKLLYRALLDEILRAPSPGSYGAPQVRRIS
jgi:hypothetical protein